MAKGKKRSGGAKKALKKQREAAAAAAASAAATNETAPNGAAPNGTASSDVSELKPPASPATNGAVRRANDFATAAPARPFAKAKQKAMVKLLMRQADKQGLQVGDKRFVIPAKWWERWCQYVDYDDDLDDDVNELMNPPPSRLNNLPLLHVADEAKLDELMGGPLRPQLKENYHYTLVPQEVWDAFACWYSAGPAIARFVVQAGDPALGNTFNRVQEQSESDGASPDEAGGVPLGPSDTSTRPNGVVSNTTASKAVAQRCASPASTSISVPKVCGACRNATTALKRCGGCQMIWYCGAACQTSHWKYHKAACRSALPSDEKEATIVEGLDGERRGKMGLRNLGNTCFMNSALQCLSHTEVITRFFLSNEYLKDINKDNPLGTGGNLAMEYDSLLKELWFGTTPSMNPASFKRAVGRFAPQFSGFQQHDSQELLAYILDGLHEDLNRVKNKPYTEAKESDGSTDDAIVAKEAWERHLLRNDSVFVDHVQGQFKSTVVCPICAKVSITFDPFNCIQLELPVQQTRKMELIFVPLEGIMTRYAVDVPKKGSILNLKEALSQRCGVAPSRLVAADIYQSMTYRVLGDSERLVRMRDEDRILVYEVDAPPPPSVGPRAPAHCGFLYHRIDGNLVGDPLFFTFDAKTTCRELVDKWSSMLSTHVAQTSKLTFARDELAPCLFLAERDGSFLRNEPLPSDKETLFIDYARQVSDELTDGLVFVSLQWSPALRSSSGSPRPDYERIVSDESVSQKQGRPSQGGLTLDDCFRDFTKPETLDQANLWYCSKCKEHRQARKTMEIWKLPDVLVLSLKRFEYRNEILRDKLDAFVDFPLTDLDMAPFCLQPAADGELVYDLYAVSNHYGSMAFGHYTAFARSWQDGNGERFPGWYSFDDSHVSPAAPTQVKSNAAYILFYKRRRMGGGSEAPSAK